MTVLVLGGTSEARALAALLMKDAIPVISSLAGRVAEPRLPLGPVRIGGFGGVEGLRDYLRAERIGLVIDATHPFAEQMTRHAFAATSVERVRYLRLERPGWADAPGAGSWHWVADHEEAARRTAELGTAPMLTIGRRQLSHFVEPLAEHRALVRVVDRPEIEVPETWRIVRSRGPYSVEAERALMAEHGCDVVVTKDSGGTYTWPKMQVAAEWGLPVVIVRRALDPWTSVDGVPVLHDPAAAAAVARARVPGRS